ncbi:cellulose synthase complex periplasmic endoglucanase BcsZ [Aliidiomarina sanyensis]|nr:cellulose synthase complex periplasmic endoglucanase BcsZ [Aliidiomarina sanyensis]
MMRPWLGLGVLFIVAALTSCRPAMDTQHPDEPAVDEQDVTDVLSFRWHYQRFLERLVASDGRVIDRSTERRISTSEGQAYGMWFALLSDDRGTFEKLLQWADANLARGRLGDQLPAWLWGRSDDGDWRILDENPAVDADIWMTYALFAGAERWQEPRYAALAHRLSRRILETSTRQQNGQRILLPAPFGFTRDNYVLMNPSYLTLTVFEGLAAYSEDARWLELERSSRRLFLALLNTGNGVVPDWLGVSSPVEIVPFEQLEARDQDVVAYGSYDAIRTYLWLWWDAQRQSDERLFHGLSRIYHLTDERGFPPERLSFHDEVASGIGPIGFSGLLLPVLSSYDAAFGTRSAEEQRNRIQARNPERYQDLYYDQMLLLFGLSALGCVEFLSDARLDLTAEGMRDCAL